MIDHPLRDNISRQPLAEVFGYFVDNSSEEAITSRKLKLCPYNNKTPNCNKDQMKDPLGVCSIFVEGKPVMICPVRLKQNWKVITDIADHFFPPNVKWTALPDVQLYDKFNHPIDTIDYVIVAYDRSGGVIDFIFIDILGIHPHGNLRQPFDLFVKDNEDYFQKDIYPKIKLDYISTVQKIIAPRIIFKSRIFNAWKKKAVYVLDKSLFDKLPKFSEESKEKAEISWFSYELNLDSATNCYKLNLAEVVHTLVEPTLLEITKIEPAPIEAFINHLPSMKPQNF